MRDEKPVNKRTVGEFQPHSVKGDGERRGSWDAIVVGAGLGGLTAALRLAKEDLRVLVVEAASHPGGTAYVYRRGEFLFPMGPLGCSNPELVRLTLSRSGLEEPPDFNRVHYGLHAFGLFVSLSRSFPDTAAALARLFPDEKEAVEAFFQDMEWLAREHLAISSLTGLLSKEVKGPGFRFPYPSTQGGLRAKRNKRVFPLGARAGNAARSGSGTMPGVARQGLGPPPAQRQSAASYLEGMVNDPRLRRILGSMGTRDPYSNLALLASMWYLLCESGIYYPQGGFHGLGDTLATLLGGKADVTCTQPNGVPEARALSSAAPGPFATSPGEGRGARRLAPSPPGTGACLLLGCRVRRILVRGGRARGVQLDDGSTIDATAVVSNADFKNTFLRLVDAGELPTPFLRRLESASLTSSNLQVCLGLEARKADLSAFRECSHLIHRRPGSGHGEAEGSKREWRDMEPEPERLAGEELELCLLSADDATLAPPGKAVLVIRVAVPHGPFLRFRGRVGSRKPGYPEFKARLGRALVREASSLVPGLEDAVQVMDVATPLTFEERGGRFEGAVAGWSWEFEEAEDRLVELVLTPISGLYMAGHQAFSMLALGGVPSAVLSGLRAAEYVLQGWGPVGDIELPGTLPAGPDR
ncbi:MAG: phytoene desaturase family protein [Actinomycetota bacterium]